MHKINNRKRIKKCGSNRGKGRGKKAKQKKIAKRAVKIDAEVKWAWVDRANGFARENSSMVNRTYTHTLGWTGHHIRSDPFDEAECSSVILFHFEIYWLGVNYYMVATTFRRHRRLCCCCYCHLFFEKWILKVLSCFDRKIIGNAQVAHRRQ